MTEKEALMTAREAANYLRISLATLGRVEKGDALKPYRTPGGHRRYSLEMLNCYLESTKEGGVMKAEKALEVLKWVEWGASADSFKRAGACPWCYRMKTHRKGCKLAALLHEAGAVKVLREASDG